MQTSQSVFEKSFPGLHVPLRGLLRPNLVTVAPLRLLNLVLHPTKCDVHPGESIFNHVLENMESILFLTTPINYLLSAVTCSLMYSIVK